LWPNFNFHVQMLVRHHLPLLLVHPTNTQSSPLEPSRCLTFMQLLLYDLVFLGIIHIRIYVCMYIHIFVYLCITSTLFVAFHTDFEPSSPKKFDTGLERDMTNLSKARSVLMTYISSVTKNRHRQLVSVGNSKNLKRSIPGCTPPPFLQAWP
jgi:hypothetical protein